MPQIEVKYTECSQINSLLIFDKIEEVINDIDPSSGECKLRGYPTRIYKHKHIL